MRILGLPAFYHDSAAALVEDGRIVAAAQEERFTRKKHDSSFSKNAIAYCLEEAGAELDDLITWCFTTSRSLNSNASWKLTWHLLHSRMQIATGSNATLPALYPNP
jgi:predicted NodU family carbamoyl transferase